MELTKADQCLLNDLTNKDTTAYTSAGYDSKFIQIIHSINAAGSRNNIPELIALFLTIHKHNPSTTRRNICICISRYILNKFLNGHSSNIEYPKTLFSGTFLHFLIKNELFFEDFKGGNESDLAAPTKSLFKILTSKLTNYFDIQYMSEYHTYYIDHGVFLLKFINTQMLSFIMLNIYEINICLRFVRLVLAAPIHTGETAQQKRERDELYDIGYKVFTMIYSGVSNMMYLNTESLNTYNDIFGGNINRNRYSKEINSQVSECAKYITTIRTFTKYINRLHISLRGETTDIIDVLPNLLQRTTYVGDNFATFEDNIKPTILDILHDSTLNIHQRCKIVCRYQKLDHTFSEILLQIFSELKSYNIDNGFKEKNRVRGIILKNISDTMKYDDTVSNSFINHDFIIVYTRHMNSLLLDIIHNKEILKKNPVFYNQMIFGKFMKYLSDTVSMLHIFLGVYSGDMNVLFETYAEIFYSIWLYSYKNKLFDMFTLFGNHHVPKLLASYIEGIYSNIFICFETLLRLDEFVSVFTTKSEFYNKTIMKGIIEHYGSFVYKLSPYPSNNTENSLIKFKKHCVGELLSEYIKKIDSAMENYTPITYDIDAPDEFLDPIMFSVISTPVEIPGGNHIVDKSIIYNHLMFNETNPFTNQSLTREMLDRYNERPDVIARIQTYKATFKLWELKHTVVL